MLIAGKTEERVESKRRWTGFVGCALAGAILAGCSADTAEDGPTTQDAGTPDTGGCLPDPDSGASDADASVTPEAGKEAGQDADSGDRPDTGELKDCPDDMVEVGVFCVDRYEASRSDATAEDQGTAVDVAHSVSGVIPWHVSPMSMAVLAEFEAACEGAGKRICRPSEFLAACEGPSGSAYVFGDTFDSEVCNCVDTFCDDWCAENGVAPESCATGANCGYAYNCYRVMPTGSFPGCTNELGTFDLTGNAWEVVPSSVSLRGFEVRGGAYNCAGAQDRLKCTFDASWDSLFAGFRCCLDR